MSKRPPYVPGKEPPEMIARPKCPQCEKRLRPLINSDWVRVQEPVGFSSVETNRRWEGGYAGYGAFCSTSCCISFANAAHRAGYRIKRG